MYKLALARINYSQVYGMYDDGATYEDRDILIPYQLLILAASARRHDIDVKIFDGEVGLLNEEQLIDNILAWSPDFVGFTATTPDIDKVVYACELIKLKDPLVKTIIGGCHVTALIDDMQSMYADYIVTRYGEKAIIEIVNGNCKEGIVAIYPSEYQFKPEYSMLDYSDYQFTDLTRGRVNAASVMTTYGCPFGCRFCFHDRNLRYRNIDDFVQDIDYLYNCKNVRYFYIYDDTFLLRRERAIEILSKLKRFKDAHFQCLTRANLIDEEIAEKLKEANFVRVSMGLESGSDEILGHIAKGMSTEDGIKACHILHDVDIEARASFILGLPYETHETINETIKFSKSLELYHANFNIMTPYPGTRTYDMALREEGLRFKEKRYATEWAEYRRWGKAIIETYDLSAKDLENYQVKAQVEFYSQDKVYKYYHGLFQNGNKSRYFYRPLNFAWRYKFNIDISFWDELDNSGIVNPERQALEAVK